MPSVDPICAHCGKDEFDWRKKSLGYNDVLLIYCKGCLRVAGVANDIDSKLKKLDDDLGVVKSRV